MNIKDYYGWVSDELKVNKNGSVDADLLNYTSGMTEECSEILKVIDKTPLHSDIQTSPIERDKFLEETGDYLWYVTAYHVLTNGNCKEFESLIHEWSRNHPHMEINALMCDSAKLQGMFRKIIFLNKEVDRDEIDIVYRRCVNRFTDIISYFGFIMHQIADYNRVKLGNRYPQGRSSKFFLELVKREKDE